MASPYVYAPLPGPHHVRLLRVWCEEREPASLQNDPQLRDPIPGRKPPGPLPTKRLKYERHIRSPPRFKGKLIPIELEESTLRYKAVSYAWEDPTKTSKIFMEDGSYIDITASAAAVLTWIVASNEKGVFWIDAICINQANLDERSSQVRLMWQIFSQANHVIAWAGVPSEDSGRALRFARKLYQCLLRIQEETGEINRYSLHDLPGYDADDFATWGPLARFILRPFFRRLWIVQELASAGDVTLICGCDGIPFDDLARVYHVICHKINGRFLVRRQYGNPFEIESSVKCIFEVWETRWLLQEGEWAHSLPGLLHRSKSFAASDPKDRVYALLNLCPNEDVTPDYNKPVEAVYTEVALRSLTMPRSSLQVLYAAGIGQVRNLKDLPSWVPDWSSEVSDQRVQPFGPRPKEPRPLSEPAFQACGIGAAAELTRVVTEGDVITIRGRVLTSIRSKHGKKPLRMQDVELDVFLLQKYEWLRRLSQIFPEHYVYPTGQPFFPDVLSRVLVSDSYRHGITEESAGIALITFFAIVAGSSFREFVLERDECPRIVLDRRQELDDIRKGRSAQFSGTDQDLGKADSSQQLSTPDLVEDAKELYSNEDAEAADWINEVETSSSGEEEEKRTSKKATYTDSQQKYWDAVQPGLIWSNSTVPNQRVFTTHNGYAGLGPVLMQEGDVLCLMYGLRVPCLVRKRAMGDFEYVGECYVYGLMHGEGLSMGEEADITLH